MANIELTAVYLAELHRWDETVVIRCELPPAESAEPAKSKNGNGNGQGNGHAGVDSFAELFGPEVLTVKTTAAIDGPDSFVPHCSYRFYGQWTIYTNRRTGREEKQFAARTWVRCQPHGQAGVIRYLCQCPGIKEGRARKLWDKFGADAVRILRETPDVAASVLDKGFNEEKQAAAAEWLKGEQALENCSIDLIDLLGSRGFPKETPKRAVREWGNRAAGLIRSNPYLLMRFRGCGFLRTDKLYLDLGGNPARLKRQALCAWYSIARDTEGNTWYSPAVVEGGLRAQIAGAGVQAIPAARLAIRAKALAKHRDDRGSLWLAEYKKARNERYIAERVARMLSEKYEWPPVADLDVSDHQREQLAQALTGPLAIFGGGPGTGKTYSAARVVKALLDAWGWGSIAVAAPTGKAAVRITEAMQGYGIQLKARTIHSLLGVASRSEGEGWGFQHDENDPLPFRAIVVDESSMIDTDLFSSLLRAIPDGSQLLLVGDVNQLPPVGHGRPLFDLIAAGVPYGELREIKRNWGLIVQACADLRDGRRWQTAEALDPDAGKNLKLVATGNNTGTADAIERLLATIRAKGLVDPIWDCQVIVAVNAKSELSRKELNKRLQALLNPAGEQAAGNPFRKGDKVVCLKNGWYPAADSAGGLVDEEDVQRNEKDEVYVANGEQGRVIAVEEKRTVVQLAAPDREVVIPRGKAEGEDAGQADDEGQGAGGRWDLAYAISCHKSQGSEWPVVVVALDEYPGAKMVCSRAWLYTAMSRAKQVCFMVGKRSTAESMCRRDAIGKRKTFLKELIVEASNGNSHLQGVCGTLEPVVNRS